MYNPLEEGKTHINAYSQSRTELGRLLSNFTKVKFKCEDGEFESIEGYWYWLIVNKSNPKREQLRKVSGFKAKQLGRQLTKTDWCDNENFKLKIKRALWYKTIALPKLQKLLLENNLPIVHYYFYGEAEKNPKIIIPKNGKWVWEAFEVIKNHLIKLKQENN